MPDDMNDDFEVDTTDLDVPADAVEDTDDATDGDFDFAGLTDEEIEAINAEETDETAASDSESDSDDTDDSGSDDGDNDTAEGDSTASDEVVDSDSADDSDNGNDDDYEAEAATVAEKRAAIDTEFDAKLAELEELGEKYDSGDMLDGAYNAAKARLDRELKRIEVREAELITKEDTIAERETSQQEQFQNDFAVAVTDFMGKAENKTFVEGSPEFAALDQQLGVIAQSMPPGTPFDVLLNKARQAVSSYMDLPEAEKEESKPVKKDVKPEPEHMPSISNMPSVVPNSNDDGKFSHLDKLDGPALERAIADMSEAQQNEYLNQ